VSIRLSVTCR